MIWLSFGIGMILGGMIGVTVMCLCAVSGLAGRRDASKEPVKKK